jgi:hypothetical protein
LIYRWAADLTVVIHFAFILFVIFGGYLVRKRAWVKWLHLPALAYGFLIATFNWYCPLTLLELEFRRRAGLSFYEGGFISEYLNRLIYLDVSRVVIIVGTMTVCLLNGLLYIRLSRTT